WALLGTSVAIDEHLVVLGIDGEHRAWVLERAAGGWLDTGTLGELAAPTRQVGFSSAVGVHGDLAARGVAVQAPRGPPPTLPGTQEIDVEAMRRQLRSPGTGEVHVYARQTDGWRETTVLSDPGGTAGE